MARDDGAVAGILGAQVGQRGGELRRHRAPGYVEAAVDRTPGAARRGGLVEGEEGEVRYKVLDRRAAGKGDDDFFCGVIAEDGELGVGEDVDDGFHED